MVVQKGEAPAERRVKRAPARRAKSTAYQRLNAARYCSTNAGDRNDERAWVHVGSASAQTQEHTCCPLEDIAHQKASKIRCRRDAQNHRLRAVRELVVLPQSRTSVSAGARVLVRLADAYQCRAERNGSVKRGVVRAHVEHEVLRTLRSAQTSCQRENRSAVKRTCVNFDLYVCRRLD